MATNNFQISLAAARVNAKLTQEDVAEKMHVTKQTKIYGISLDYIFLPCYSTKSRKNRR